jgi:hypothetical protein
MWIKAVTGIIMAHLVFAFLAFKSERASAGIRIQVLRSAILANV